MVSFDSEIPEAQLASNLGVCLVDPNTLQVTVVYGPLARVHTGIAFLMYTGS